MNKAQQIMEQIERDGGTNRGRNELLKYLNGESLTARQSCVAKCYDCMGYGAAGRVDCKIDTCVLYPFMPYSSKPKAKRPVKGGSKSGLFGHRGKQQPSSDDINK